MKREKRNEYAQEQILEWVILFIDSTHFKEKPKKERKEQNA